MVDVEKVPTSVAWQLYHLVKQAAEWQKAAQSEANLLSLIREMRERRKK